MDQTATPTEAETIRAAPEPRLPAERQAARGGRSGEVALYDGPTVELSAASLEDERFVIEKVLDQHMVYVEKTTDALGAFVRVIFLLNAAATVLLLTFLGALATEEAALARFTPSAADAMEIFMTGAVFAVLSGLCAWWTYSTIAHRKRMLLERVFLKETPAAPGGRARDLVVAMIDEGRSKSTLQFWLGAALALAGVAAFILGCQQVAVGFAG